MGLTAEKDPGEQFFRGAQKQGFDFYSFHAFYRGGKYLKSFAFGDYQIQLGQGLNLWSSYAFGKSSDILTMKRNPIPIKPYTSVDESRFFRGAAINLGYRNFDLLILDEATSSLNKDYEDDILGEISSLFRDKIIITISHDLNVLKYCNKKINIKNNEKN